MDISQSHTKRDLNLDHQGSVSNISCISIVVYKKTYTDLYLIMLWNGIKHQKCASRKNDQNYPFRDKRLGQLFKQMLLHCFQVENRSQKCIFFRLNFHRSHILCRHCLPNSITHTLPPLEIYLQTHEITSKFLKTIWTILLTFLPQEPSFFCQQIMIKNMFLAASAFRVVSLKKIVFFLSLVWQLKVDTDLINWSSMMVSTYFKQICLHVGVYEAANKCMKNIHSAKKV